MRPAEPALSVVLVLAIGLGAWSAWPLSPWIGGLVAAMAWWRRWPWLLCVGGFLLAAGLGHRAASGLESPAPTSVTRETVTLVSDPDLDGDRLEVDVRWRGRRLRAEVASEPAGAAGAAAIAGALAGERLVLSGRVVGVEDRPDLAVRHIAGLLLVDETSALWPGDPLSRLANGLRRAVERGARPLGPERAALFTGIVFGDDRAQSAAATDDFRAAGLSHLLAVSGQNVAFVLVVAGPVLLRLRLLNRFVVTLAVLGFFALVTRFEPSVLRATAMAAVVAAGALGGRPTGRSRTLALAVAGLLLVDPLLVRSVGFALSVLATAGIVALAPAIEGRLVGPAWITAPTAVTLAAQVAVAPLLAVVFGGVPMVSVPANLLAGPAAGAVMVWGLVAGPVAGLFPALAGTLHLPTALLLAWLDTVAATAASVPLGEVRVPHLLALAGLVLVGRHRGRWGVGRPARRRGLRRAVGLAVVVVLAAPAMGLARREPLRGRTVAPGAQVWRDGPAVAVRLDGRARAGPVLTGLRRVGIRRVGLVALSSDAASALATARALAERASLTVLGPAGLATDAVTPIIPGSVHRAGPIVVEARVVTSDRVTWLVRVDRSGSRSVRSPGARGARSPPVRHHPPGAGDGDPEPHP